MRNPKKVGKPSGKAKGKGGSKPPKAAMETDAPSSSQPSVWRPGIDEIGADEELDYDPTAYDCLHRFQLDWPCLSFDIASTSKANYVAFVKLDALGQGRHGKKKAKKDKGDDDDDEDEDMSSSDDESETDDNGGEAPPKMHYRMVNQPCGVNRVRSCPQQPAVVAVWGDNGQVKMLDGDALLKELAADTESMVKAKAKVDLKPLQMHAHSTEGYAMDWSSVKAGRFASGDCNKKIHVWEPQDGGRWAVSGAFSGHESSVEDLQWSPSEDTVFASCSADKTVRVWDTREKAKAMITVQAHDCDVNVISWNKSVAYMLASGADDGTLRIWDLRSFSAGAHVSNFAFHKKAVTSVEWCPYEGSMLASCSADNQLAVWDLALERDPEEEEALAPAGNAAAPEDLPAQLLFLHCGQNDLKELHWHTQVPGLIGSTAADGFNMFKASNM
ncbi:hypothetical protein FOA52_000521 [Chlamydomonas sp. UWO 241]|nr:hypothetical protein FOA52_000521 [Chlamydomonas sp. UWO 241]